MRENLKKLSHGTLVYGIGHILTRSLAFLLLPLYTNVFTPAELGIVTLLLAFLAVMNLVYIYGFDSAFLRFYITENEHNEKAAVLATSFITVLVTSIVFSILISFNNASVSHLLFSDPEYGNLIKICVYILSLDALAYIPLLLLRAQERSTRYIFTKIAAVIVNLVLNIVFVVSLEMGITGVFYAQVCSSGVMFVLVLSVLLPHLSFVYSVKWLKQMLAFGLPYLPTTFGVILMELIDRYFLMHWHGAAEVGIYGAGYRLAMVMALLIAGFRFAWHPFFLSVSEQDNIEKLFARVLTYFLVTCAVFYLFFSFYIDDIVHLQFAGKTLFASEFWQSTRIVSVIMLAYVLFGVYAVFVAGIHLSKKTKYLPFITFSGAASNILGNFILIPKFGMDGAAWATVSSYAIMVFVLYVIVQKYYPVPYEFLRVFKLVIIVLFIFAINSKLQLSPILRLILLSCLPVFLHVFRFWQPEELRFMRKLRDVFTQYILRLFSIKNI